MQLCINRGMQGFIEPGMGVEAKAAVPALLEALNDGNDPRSGKSIIRQSM